MIKYVMNKKMNRREFLKKSLEGIIAGSIPLTSNCTKDFGTNQLPTNTTYLEYTVSGGFAGINDTFLINEKTNYYYFFLWY